MTKKGVILFLTILITLIIIPGCGDQQEDPDEGLEDEVQRENEDDEEETGNDYEGDENEQEEEEHGDADESIEEKLEKIGTALKEEEWEIAGKTLSELSKDGLDQAITLGDVQGMYDDDQYFYEEITELLQEELVISGSMAGEFMDEIMENLQPPLDTQVLNQSDEEIRQWFDKMESWRVYDVMLFRGGFTGILDSSVELHNVLVTEEAVNKVLPFDEHVKKWFYSGHDGGFGYLLGADEMNVEIAGVPLLFTHPGGGFGPMHPAIELLSEGNDLLDVEVKSDSVVMTIEGIKVGDSLSPGTYKLSYEIEELEEGKFAVRGYEVEEVSE